MYSKKNLLAAVVLGLSMSLTSVAPAIASADDVSVQVNVQQNVKGSVNWEKGAEADVEAWGGRPASGKHACCPRYCACAPCCRC